MAWTTNLLIKYFVLALLIVVVLVLPDKILFNNSRSLCIHLMVTDIQCPVCGMTRAMHELLSMRIASAIEYNSSSILVIMLFVNQAIIDFYKKSKGLILMQRILLVLLLISLSVLYLIRIGDKFQWWI